MPVASWPGAGQFPQVPLHQGNGVQLGDNRLKFQPDVGRPMMRARSTTRDDAVAYVFKASNAERGNFLTWYKTTIGNGALPFTFTDPELGALATFQFVSPPSYSRVAPDIYMINCSLLRFGA